MGRLGVDANVHVTAGRGQPGRHGQVVRQEDVLAADDEQRRRQAAQVAEHGGDVGIGPVGRVARVRLDEELVVDQPAGGCLPAHVVGPELQRGAGEGAGHAAVAQPQQRRHRQRRARRYAADRQARRAEARGGLLHEPQRRRLAVLGCGRPRMLRGQPVVHAHDRDAEGVGQAAVVRVSAGCQPHVEAAAVDVQIDAARRPPRARRSAPAPAVRRLRRAPRRGAASLRPARASSSARAARSPSGVLGSGGARLARAA